MEANDKFQKSLEAIRKRFLYRLQDWHPVFSGFNEKLQKDSAISSQEYSAMFSQIHQLAGTSRTLGFPEIGDHAIEIDGILYAILNETQDPEHRTLLKKEYAEFLQQVDIAIDAVEEQTTDDRIFHNTSTRKHDKEPYLLVVDDDALLRSLLKEGLESFDFKIRQAANGTKMLAMLEKFEQPDLIIMDINMPEIDGFQLLKHIKENNRTKDIPVLMLSSRKAQSDIDKATKLGASAYMTKPFDSEELLSHINKLLNLS